MCIRDRSEILRLGVVSNPDTSRLEGQRDMTIDAGFVIPAALGDYVWIDLNRDGIQDPDEPGVNGVRVRLYTVDDLSLIHIWHAPSGYHYGGPDQQGLFR